MWLSRILPVLPFVLLAACGFEPVYGPHGQARAFLNSVLVQEPKSKEEYLLTRQIESRLGRAVDPRFDLNIKIALSQSALNITPAGNTERFNLLGTVEYVLHDRDKGQISASGSVNSFTGYSATGTTVATQAAQEDARKRLMVILADLLIAELVTVVNADS